MQTNAVNAAIQSNNRKKEVMNYTVLEKQEAAHDGGELCEVEECEECCDHSDLDGCTCLICGKDMGETLAARADHFKD